MNNLEIINILSTAADYAILSLNEKGIVVSANPAVRAIFGKQEGDIEGRPLTELIPDLTMLDYAEFEPVQARGGLESFDQNEIRQASCQWLEALAALKNAGESFETEVSAKDEKHWIELETFKVVHNETIVFAVIIKNITRRKRNEREIKRLNEELEQMVEQRTADLEARTEQVKKVVNSCREELQSINHTYQHMKEQQMAIIEGLEPQLIAKVPELNELQLKAMKTTIRDELVECMNLYSQDQITDQKFLLAIITLTELFSHETAESHNLKPGQLSGTSQDEVDDLLDSLGI